MTRPGKGMSPPRAARRPCSLSIHGDTRIDEYFWLRDDTRSDPEVLAYLEAENRYFSATMAPLDALVDRIYEEILGRIIPDHSSVPYPLRGYWYYWRFEPGREYAIHARRRGSLDAPEEVLLDENERAAEGGFYQLRGMEVSDDHRYLALAEDRSGRRTNDIRIVDTQTGKTLPEVIQHVSGALAWSADGRYLFYHQLDPQTLLDSRLMRHRLGTDPGQDRIVYEEADRAFYNHVYRSRSGEYLFLRHHSIDCTEVQMLAANDPTGEFRPFLEREPGHEYGIDHAAGRFFIRSNWHAPNFRVMTAPGPCDRSEWQERVPHRDGVMVMGMQAFDTHLLLQERIDTLPHIRVLAHDDSLDQVLTAGEPVSTMWPEANVSTDAKRLRYACASYISPKQIWEYDLQSGRSILLQADQVPGEFDSRHYRTDRFNIEARDGEPVPVTLVWRVGFEPGPERPVLIDGYGAYGFAHDPWFSPSIFSLLDRGFVYAEAHVRGGTERGRRWYELGRQHHKMNSFTDFIDVTRALQERGLVDASRTFACGGSAGGLLVGAVINMAPQLYLGAAVAVPFVDVVTTMLDKRIPLTTAEFNEWGNPKDPGDYAYMLRYSPYDQVVRQDYPNLFVTTGLHDSQVQYFEPAKWVARLRERKTDDRRLLFRINMEAGHGGESGRYQRHIETAQEYAWMIDLAGLA